MKTFQEQQEYFKSKWPTLRSAVEQGGSAGAIDYIQGFEDDLERRVMFVFARQGLVMDDWNGKSFDPYIEVCNAGIAEMLRQAAAAADDDTKAARTTGAHIVSFNLAADLADCWPGDDAERTAAHFERGVQAADDCIGWCDPSNLHGLSNDWWAKGMHELSLSRTGDALASWNTSWDLAKQGAEADGSSTEVGSEAGFGVLLLAGYVGIAQACAGDESGIELLDMALGSYKAQLNDKEKAGDAQFGIDQLSKVRAAYV